MLLDTTRSVSARANGSAQEWMAGKHWCGDSPATAQDWERSLMRSAHCSRELRVPTECVRILLFVCKIFRFCTVFGGESWGLSRSTGTSGKYSTIEIVQ